jgi:hypothetical protein
VIAYHFASFGDAVAEAAHFVSVAGDKARVLDSETNSNVEWQNEFLSALHLPSNEEMDYGSASTLPRSGIRALLWPASYGRDYGFGDAWQFTDAQVVDGIPGLVDASVWIGSLADFNSLFNIEPPAPPVVEVEEMPLYATNSTGTGFVVATDLSSKRGLPDAADAAALLATGLYRVVQLDDALLNSIPG